MSHELDTTNWYCERGCGMVLNSRNAYTHRCGASVGEPAPTTGERPACGKFLTTVNGQPMHCNFDRGHEGNCGWTVQYLPPGKLSSQTTASPEVRAKFLKRRAERLGCSEEEARCAAPTPEIPVASPPCICNLTVQKVYCPAHGITEWKHPDIEELRRSADASHLAASTYCAKMASLEARLREVDGEMAIVRDILSPMIAGYKAGDRDSTLNECMEGRDWRKLWDFVQALAIGTQGEAQNPSLGEK